MLTALRVPPVLCRRIPHAYTAYRTLACSAARMTVTNLVGASGPTPTPASTFDVVHPGTGRVVHAVQRSTAADLSAAVDAAHAAALGWRSTPLGERKAILSRAAALLREEGWATRLVEANVAETSCGKWWAAEQVGAVPHFIDALVGAADEALAEASVEFHGCESATLTCPCWR